MVDFSSFLEANQSATIVSNSTGRIVGMNQAAGDLLKCKAEQVAGTSLVDLLPALSPFFTKRKDKDAGRVNRYVEHYTLPSGDSLEILIHTHTLRLDDQVFFWFTLSDPVNKKSSEDRRDRAFYKKLLRQSRDVIMLLDAANRITYVSPSCTQLMGYKPKELLQADDIMEFIYEEDRRTFEKEWKNSLRNRDNLLVNRFRIVHKNGQRVWMEVDVRREFNEKGRHIQSIASLRDITDRIAHQLELERVKERYQLAVEAGHNGIWDYSIRDKKLFVDDSLKSLLGYAREDEITEQFFWENLVDVEDSKSLREALNGYIDQGKAYFEETFQMHHKRRVLLWVLGRGKIFYEKGKAVRIICSVTDITDKIKSNERLRNALINFKAIFDAFPDLFFRLNRVGDFLEVMAGESADHFIADIRKFEGRNMKEAFPEEVYLKLYDTLQLAFERRKVELCEYELHSEGTDNNFEARIIAISDDEAICIVRNITESVRTNRELIKARKTAEEALNAKDEFLSMMSHEIRTPLNVVIGMIYLLMQQNPDPDQLKLINVLKFSSDNLLRLINDLLDFSKIKAGKLVFEEMDFNIREFFWTMYESYKMQLDSSRVNLELKLDDQLPSYVKGDYNRLAQIMNNLLSNALKFTDSGEIRIEVDELERTDQEIKVRFIIKDSGMGISEEKIGSIFEPFQQGETDITRRYGGTGLGLTIVRQLVELLGGKIEVSSKLGEGTMFTIMMPLKTVDEDRIAIRDEHTDAFARKIQNIRVLYAEDVTSNQFLMKGYADLWEFELDVASNGEEAVEMFIENDYDVIMLDLQMPVMDGFQAAERIRDIEQLNNQSTPIIAVTGDISEKTIEALSESGMNDYVTKPINPKIMIEKIQDLLRERKPSRLAVSRKTGEMVCDKTEPINFKEVDYLYGEVPTQYIKLIDLLLNEFKRYRSGMIKALKEEDFDEFRHIRHSMRSNMRLLHMHRMDKLVDEIRNAFVNSTLPPGGGHYVEKITLTFDELLEKLQEKVNALT